MSSKSTKTYRFERIAMNFTRITVANPWSFAAYFGLDFLIFTRFALA